MLWTLHRKWSKIKHLWCTYVDSSCLFCCRLTNPSTEPLPRSKTQSEAGCFQILDRLYSLLSSLNPELDAPYTRCQQLFGTLKTLMPQCFRISCLSTEYLSVDAWIASCQRPLCFDVNGDDMEDAADNMPNPRITKRRWGDTVLACINSLCGNSEGSDRVSCIVNRCQKRSGWWVTY